MATITNTEKRLITAPQIPGHKAQQWLPGRNPLDERYWKAAKEHTTVKRWKRLGMIKTDMKDDMPDPNTPPDQKTLDSFTQRELERALKDQAIPVQWHPALEKALEERKKAEMTSRLAPNPTGPADPHESKSLKALNITAAKPLIEAETDVEVLSAWAEADDRKGIEEAIDERLTELATSED